MKQRALDANGDFSFGTALPFLEDTPYCVAQAVMTRLRLRSGEWFLDLQEGTHYDDQILGFGTQDSRDLAIRSRILDTPGVQQIAEYISILDKGREFSVIATVDTIYGSIQLQATV